MYFHWSKSKYPPRTSANDRKTLNTYAEFMPTIERLLHNSSLNDEFSSKPLKENVLVLNSRKYIIIYISLTAKLTPTTMLQQISHMKYWSSRWLMATQWDVGAAGDSQILLRSLRHRTINHHVIQIHFSTAISVLCIIVFCQGFTTNHMYVTSLTDITNISTLVFFFWCSCSKWFSSLYLLI